LPSLPPAERAKPLESVEVTAQPDKSLYKIDEAFVPTGARLTATYTDKSTKVIEVTEEMCSEVDTSTAGSKQVTVSYTEKEVTKTATMTVTVVGAEISVTIYRGNRCGQKYAHSEIQAYAGA